MLQMYKVKTNIYIPTTTNDLKPLHLKYDISDYNILQRDCQYHTVSDFVYNLIYKYDRANINFFKPIRDKNSLEYLCKIYTISNNLLYVYISLYLFKFVCQSERRISVLMDRINTFSRGNNSDEQYKTTAFFKLAKPSLIPDIMFEDFCKELVDVYPILSTRYLPNDRLTVKPFVMPVFEPHYNLRPRTKINYKV
jgi:hypothetical protein